MCRTLVQENFEVYNSNGFEVYKLWGSIHVVMKCFTTTKKERYTVQMACILTRGNEKMAALFYFHYVSRVTLEPSAIG